MGEGWPSWKILVVTNSLSSKAPLLRILTKNGTQIKENVVVSKQ